MMSQNDGDILKMCLIILRNYALTLSHYCGPYHRETSPLICRENQWTGLYMIETTVMKEL